MTTGQREQGVPGEVTDAPGESPAPDEEPTEGAQEQQAPEEVVGSPLDQARAQIDRLRLSWDHLKRLLYLLTLCRHVDERLETLYRQGKLPGAFYSGRGQEGTHVGAAYALMPEDSLFPTHRDLSAQLAKGLDLKRVMAQFWGRIDGYTRGRDGNSHVGDWKGHRTFTAISHLPIAYPVAAGAALAYKMNKEPRVALAICGDGATSNGRWHESLNVSSIHQLPVVWLVNNNLYAYSTPNQLEFAVPTIAERASAYGMPGVRVDAANVLDVYQATRVAVERARRGEGPTLIESVSLRWRGHAGHDPAKYVPKELLEEYMEFKDPVKRFRDLLLALKVVSEKELGGLDERIAKEFDQCYAYAQASPAPSGADVTKGLWAGDGYWENEPRRDGAGGTGT
ncbi:MAG TPA: thiamine pyrophosphate-dependent dehydrogenase E1 component subunit alpha [Actinomycetota bacterium]|nr:thiamine pyrophosphate-dependent dehydrogenase E1 component subunit alpha [Actinomycetota bacterium]